MDTRWAAYLYELYSDIIEKNVYLFSCLVCFPSSEDRCLIRIILMKTNREAGNCWSSLLEGEYCANAWVQDQMQRKLTLERFQREVSLMLCYLKSHVVWCKVCFLSYQLYACLFNHLYLLNRFWSRFKKNGPWILRFNYIFSLNLSNEWKVYAGTEWKQASW